MKRDPVPGPIAVASQFPGWKFEMKAQMTALGLARIIAGRRGDQRIILVVDHWDEVAARTEFVAFWRKGP